VALVVLVLSLVVFVMSIFDFVPVVKDFVLGSFGVSAYVMLFFASFFSIGVLGGKKFVYSTKYVFLLFLCYLFFVCVMHILFTRIISSTSVSALSYGEYLRVCFSSLFTPGGVVVGAIVYPVSSMLHDVAGLTIFAVAFVLSVYFVVSYLQDIKEQKLEKSQKANKRYQNFENISSELGDSANEKTLDENMFFEKTGSEAENIIPRGSFLKRNIAEGQSIQNGYNKTQEDAEDIFIKDTNEKYDEAKKRLGLGNTLENTEAKVEGYSQNKQNDLWQNRAIKKDDDEEIHDDYVFGLKVDNKKRQREMLNAQSKNYINTLFDRSLQNQNPIINAENIDDYREKMKSYVENNTKPFSRELDVNQTLQAKNRVEDEHQNLYPQSQIQGYVKNSNGYYVQNSENASKTPDSRTDFEKKNFDENSKRYDDNKSGNFGGVNIEGLQGMMRPIERNDVMDQDSDATLSKFDNHDISIPQDKIDNHDKRFDNPSATFAKNVQPSYDASQNSDSVGASLGRTYNLPSNLKRNLDGNKYMQLEMPGANKDTKEPQFRYDAKYVRPPINLLKTYVNDEDLSTNHEHNIEVLERVLDEFKIPAKVEAVRRGSAVTRYELRMPVGIPVRKIHQHASDIALALASPGEIRIETPIRGKSAVGIEVPNSKIDTVGLKDIIASSEFQNAKKPLTFALGKDIDGQIYNCDLASMPHLLVAGSTGSGKSVCLNTLILSLIYRTSPEDLRFILVDPKKVEFTIFNDLPHMLIPKAITEPKKALNAFDWLINEMERRFTVFQDSYVKNIGEYNSSPEVLSGKFPKLPYIVLIVDELADLVVTTNKKELEEKIIRLTQKARAAGIHVILATQRPSVDIITGSIKINLPSRIAFAVTSFVDSKTILDQGGAEKLLGRGDMLYSPQASEPIRVQGAFVDTPEVRSVIEFVKQHNPVKFDDNLEKIINSENGASGGVGNTATVGASSGEEFDSLMPDCLKLVIENNQASISMLQRRFSIGFSRAARIIDQMELAKFISSSDGSKPRTVYITMDDYEKLYGDRN